MDDMEVKLSRTNHGVGAGTGTPPSGLDPIQVIQQTGHEVVVEEPSRLRIVNKEGEHREAVLVSRITQ